MKLRDYQESMLDRARAELKVGRNPLLVSPCGSGKGALISLIVQKCVDAGKSVVFAVHGKNLVADMSQNRVAKLGIPHGVLLGGYKRERRHPVQIASIDTLHRMEFPPEADFVIVDEAHMSASPTWKKALGRYPNARVIGMTATPIRLDGKGLGKKTGGLFDSMVVGPSEVDLIKLGYLVRSKVMIGSSAQPSKAELKSDKKLAAMCDKTTLIGDIVGQWKKHSSGRKTAAFGVDCSHAHHIADTFNAAGVQWAYVDADTPQRERDTIWKDLDHGNLMGVSSVGTITTGWDHSIISCLIMARPTASLGLWKQMLGRGSRPHPGKTEFMVHDHANNSTRHAPYGCFEDAVEWSLDGDAIKESTDVSGPQVSTCWGPPVSVQVPDPSSLFGGTITQRKFPCNGKFRSGPRECPYCGYPLQVNKREIEVIAGDLHELQRAQPLWAPDEAPHVVNVAARKQFLFQMIGVAKKADWLQTPDRAKKWVEKRFADKFTGRVPSDWWPRDWSSI